jgi:hypothetical protein
MLNVQHEANWAYIKEHRDKIGSKNNTFKIVQVNDNGTVKIKKGCVTDTYNLRNIKPYYD